MNEWKLEARKPKIIADPNGTKRIRMNGTSVKAVRLHGCEMQEAVNGSILIRPTRLFEDSVRASAEKHNGHMDAYIPDIRRQAFWSGCFWGALSFGVLSALLLAARQVWG